VQNANCQCCQFDYKGILSNIRYTRGQGIQNVYDICTVRNTTCPITNERTPRVTKKHDAEAEGCTVLDIITIRNLRDYRTAQRGTKSSDPYTNQETRKRRILKARDHYYHAREGAIRPSCRLHVPSGAHTGQSPHQAVRSSRQSMRFTPCLLVISARPGVR